jgi:hypothetical protein
VLVWEAMLEHKLVMVLVEQWVEKWESMLSLQKLELMLERGLGEALEWMLVLGLVVLLVEV